MEQPGDQYSAAKKEGSDSKVCDVANGHDKDSPHHDASGWHAAEHQAEHRVSEKVVFGVAEHGLEKAAERIAEHSAERLVGGVAEHAGEHLLERGIEAAAERVGMRFLRKGTQIGCTYISAQGIVELFKVVLPFAGFCLILHMCHHDLHRVQHEWRDHGGCFATLLFFIALLADAFDALVHLLVVCSLTVVHVDHHLLHTVENLALYGAGIALFTMVVGELLSARVSARASPKEKST